VLDLPAHYRGDLGSRNLGSPTYDLNYLFIGLPEAYLVSPVALHVQFFTCIHCIHGS